MTNNAFTPWHQYIADQCAVSSKLILDRREPIPFHSDCIDAFDAAIAGIESGAQRVEVTPALTPEQCRDFWGM